MNAMERITAWSCTVHRRALGSLLLLTLLFSSCTCSQAETSNGIVLPNFNDKYSAYVRKLESGKTDIDYRDFRNSFLESRQFEVKGEKQSQYDNLKKEVSAQIEEEYFILAMMGVDLKQQSLAHSNGNAYDKMDVTTNHGDKTYYFEINQIIAKTREALKITPSKKSD